METILETKASLMEQKENHIYVLESSQKGCVLFRCDFQNGERFEVDVPFWLLERMHQSYLNKQGFSCNHIDNKQNRFIVENHYDKKCISAMYFSDAEDEDNRRYSEELRMPHKKLNKLICKILRYHYTFELDLYRALTAMEK